MAARKRRRLPRIRHPLRESDMDVVLSSHAPLRVAVLAGGDSAERAVSLESGRCVSRALRVAGHTVETIDPAQTPLADVPWPRFDVCFIALHGGAGEDGRVQRRLELMRVPYTGSGPTASQLAMDKAASKRRFQRLGIPTPEFQVFSAQAGWGEIADALDELGYPLALKPNAQGSSLGVSFAENSHEARGQWDALRNLGRFVLAERKILGREFTVAVLEGAPLPLLEIMTPHDFFDFQAKYLADTTQYGFPTDLPSGQAAELEDLAVWAADALGCSGLLRVDLMVDRAGQPWVLEVNTIPGMTSHSLAPLAAARVGLDMPALCDRLARKPRVCLS